MSVSGIKCSGIEEQRFLPENLPKNILHEKQYNMYSGNLQVDKNSNVFPLPVIFLTSFKTEFSKHPIPRIQGTCYWFRTDVPNRTGLSNEKKSKPQLENTSRFGILVFTEKPSTGKSVEIFR